ncbi:PDDEXK_1 domain-containing protein [Vibrio phage vB_VcorM_GR11A]|nr:PDDEXK_1 domain-containing protein [Vibrio phage vB_VcorM_GR11A]
MSGKRGFGSLKGQRIPTVEETSKEVHDVINGFNLLFENSKLTTEIRVMPETRVTELHPSSFPFCSTFYALDYLLHGDVFEREQQCLMGNYFTGIGTVVHEVIQNAIGDAHLVDKNKPLEHYLIGDYVCNKCKHVHKFSAYPKKCKACGQKKWKFFYEELAVWWGKKTVGHSDGLYYFGGKYWVIDYKTTSTHCVTAHKKTGKYFPYDHNVRQIRSYCAMLEDNYDVEIGGWILVYVPRDNFNNYVAVGDDITKKKKNQLKRMLDGYDLNFRRVRSFTEIKSMKKLLKTIEKIIEDKPCHNYKSYEREMKDPYFDCPYAENGVCFKQRELLKQFKKHIKKGVLIDVKQLD